MVFPKRLEINIVDEDGKKILLSDVILKITMFSLTKNNYPLGPFFSDKDGTVSLTAEVLTVAANSVLDGGLMDYVHYDKCDSKVLVEILDSNDVERLLNARLMWGVAKGEELLYSSKEELLKKIKSSNNHHLRATSVYSSFEGQGSLEVKLKTQQV